MLLLSENEVFKPSNTGRLILDTVEEGYAYQWSRTEPDAEMLALLANEAYQPIIIFPDEYVEERTRLIEINPREYCGEKKPLLIFLDGSWREARRIFRKSPYLNSLPVSVDSARVTVAVFDASLRQRTTFGNSRSCNHRTQAARRSACI